MCIWGSAWIVRRTITPHLAGWLLSLVLGRVALNCLIPALYRWQAARDGTPYQKPPRFDDRAILFGSLEHSVFYFSLAVPSWSAVAGAWVAAKAIDAWTQNDDNKRIYLMGTAMSLLFAVYGLGLTRLFSMYLSQLAVLISAILALAVWGLYCWLAGLGKNADISENNDGRGLDTSEYGSARELLCRLKQLDQFYSHHLLTLGEYRESRKTLFSEWHRRRNTGSSGGVPR